VSGNLPRNNISNEGCALSDTILPTCNRWEHLWLRRPQIDVSLVRGELPMLKSLNLELGRRSDKYSLDAFELAPQLRTVRLACRLGRLSSIKLLWGQLTELSSQGLEPDMCLDILRHCPNLIRCSFNTVCGIGPGHTPIYPGLETVLHSRLRHLQISTWWVISTFVDWLALPALRTPSLNNNGNQPITTQFHDFLSRSCMITKLVWNVHSSVDEFVSCLELIHEIIDLENLTHFSARIGTLMRRLTPHTLDDTSTLCPKL